MRRGGPYCRNLMLPKVSMPTEQSLGRILYRGKNSSLSWRFSTFLRPCRIPPFDTETRYLQVRAKRTGALDNRGKKLSQRGVSGRRMTVRFLPLRFVPQYLQHDYTVRKIV